MIRKHKADNEDRIPGIYTIKETCFDLCKTDANLLKKLYKTIFLSIKLLLTVLSNDAFSIQLYFEWSLLGGISA